MSTDSASRRTRTIVYPTLILGPTEIAPLPRRGDNGIPETPPVKPESKTPTKPSIESLIDACARIALSDTVLDRKAILVRALEPAYALLFAAKGDAEAAKLIQGRANSAKTKGRKADLALACAQLIASPGNLKAQKAASEYAAMLRFAEQQKVTVSAFADFAMKTPLRDAKAAGSSNKSKKTTPGIRLQLRLCGEEQSFGPSYLEVPADVLPILRRVLAEKNLRWDDFANSLLARLTSAGDDTEEATDA